MSIRIMSDVWALKGIPTTVKFILVKLADNADDDGMCWPSVPKIAEACEVTERTVQSALKWAESNSLLRREMRPGRSSIYVLTPAEFSPPKILHPRKSFTPTPAIDANTPYTEPSVEPSNNNNTARARATPPPTQPDVKVKNQKLQPMPTDWKPNDAHRAKTQSIGLDANELAEEFANYHLARASKFADWDRAFWTWIGNATKFSANRKNPQRGGPKPANPSIAEIGLRVAARYQDPL